MDCLYKYLVHAMKKPVHKHLASCRRRQIHRDAITARRDVRQPLGPFLEDHVLRYGVDAHVVVVSVLEGRLHGARPKIHVEVFLV